MPKGIPRNNSFQRSIIHRLKITRGHLDKVIAMVEKDEYCIDIVHQSKAIQAALRSTDNQILKNHLSTCTVEEIKKGNVDEVIAEVMSILEKS